MSRALTAVQANFRNAKVLVAENNDDQWVLMSQAWQQCLSEVVLVRVTTLQAAMSLLDEWSHQEWELPKLILLDLFLPTREDSWQFLTDIKAIPGSVRRIPIIILSSSSEQDDIVKSYNLGITAYIVKPVDFSDWLTCLNELRSYWWETNTLPPLSYGR